METQLFDALGFASLLLSLVALCVTTLGFFASLKFYRDGVELQKSASNALTKIEEKTNTISEQMTGMFDKTLDAAINKGGQIAQDFEDTTEQIENASKALINRVTNDLHQIGDGEKERLKQFISDQFKTITDQVTIAQENATEIVLTPESEFIAISQFQAKILDVIRKSQISISIEQIAESVDYSKSVVEKAVSRLIIKRLVKVENDLFSINEHKEKSDLSLIDRAFSNSSKINNRVYLAKLGAEIRKINPTFDVRVYGFVSLSEYLRAQSNYRLVDNIVNGLNHPLVEKIKL
ncbi:MAG: OST-HTH/LOTUS domain-containing protein [Candidatus Heimdallarchaeota archaeon]|nr:OST-HTH/LOTUS domain-containing protein [Candidatus Heimdallarchaeota archaeon]